MQKSKGFTIVELVITMGIFAILAAITTINLLGSQHRTSMSATVLTLIADIKQQQIKAMTGDTEGRVDSSDYGIHFENDKYVLFHGVYDESESSNFEVELEGAIEVKDITEGGNLVFAQKNGEASGMLEITLTDNLTNIEKKISINNLGVVTDVE